MKRMFILVAAVVLVALAAYFVRDRDQEHKVRTSGSQPITSALHKDNVGKPMKQQIPTVFIHGWKGSERSFNTMFQRFNHHYIGPQRAMIIRVAPNGHIIVIGKITNQTMPLIQVIFVANHESFEKQAFWLKRVFRILKSDEGISRVNVVTHSMGGKAFTGYLEHIDHPNYYPSVDKFVAIAAPFDWINGPQNEADYTVQQLKRHSYLYQHRHRLPQDLKVLAIAGIMHNAQEGDGVVALRSAFFGRYFFNHAHYTEKIVYGAKAQHSELHENPQVDQLVAHYLWHINPK
ncbi:alpha/beta hydrolase [Sporolactobacillus kofuensis]|uniref:Alpha/beta hydrolase n=1 Tax=Sporolactobacillus kofuensis TaxID=269672 RepID=A0ABW1WGG5_9BACL|nr:alpha/beta hydrolase [Sporolactobacillus kofuensis]MCO7176745.1 alpha/beta hydrolase [Sporolactobacillus kofuensis]